MLGRFGNICLPIHLFCHVVTCVFLRFMLRRLVPALTLFTTAILAVCEAPLGLMRNFTEVWYGINF